MRGDNEAFELQVHRPQDDGLVICTNLLQILKFLYIRIFWINLLHGLHTICVQICLLSYVCTYSFFIHSGEGNTESEDQHESEEDDSDDNVEEEESEDQHESEEEDESFYSESEEDDSDDNVEEEESDDDWLCNFP